MRAFLKCTICVIMVAVHSAQAEDWPMWRGPDSNGLSTETKVPLTWSDSRNIAWKTAIPGSGYSSPICRGDKIFVTSADVTTNERTLFCIDREAGTIVWRVVVAIAEIEQMHPDNSPASGTPATDGKNVYVVFQTGAKLLVAAYNFAGQPVWLPFVRFQVTAIPGG